MQPEVGVGGVNPNPASLALGMGLCQILQLTGGCSSPFPTLCLQQPEDAQITPTAAAAASTQSPVKQRPVTL